MSANDRSAGGRQAEFAPIAPLIGRVVVVLHIERRLLDFPLRAMGDADFGVPPHVLRRPELVDVARGRCLTGPVRTDSAELIDEQVAYLHSCW